MSCTDKTKATSTCPLIVTQEICWKAGMDEEVVLNYKNIDKYEVVVPTDITGYTAVLEIRVKDTDVTPILSIAASIDPPAGQFLFQATAIQTQALLTNTRRNVYVYRIIITNPSLLSRVRAEGLLKVNL